MYMHLKQLLKNYQFGIVKYLTFFEKIGMTVMCFVVFCLTENVSILHAKKTRTKNLVPQNLDFVQHRRITKKIKRYHKNCFYLAITQNILSRGKQYACVALWTVRNRFRRPFFISRRISGANRQFSVRGQVFFRIIGQNSFRRLLLLPVSISDVS